MHWSTRRALDAVAKKGHAQLDAQLLDALSRDEAKTPAVARLQHSGLPAPRQRHRALPAARPARQRSVVPRS